MVHKPIGADDVTGELPAPVEARIADTIDTAVAVVQGDIDAHEARTDNPHTVTKAQVGLSNVDNTSDANKPVSTAQAAADALKVAKAGDTMTGPLIFDRTGDEAIRLIRSNNPADLKRWQVANQATSGDLTVDEYTDAGSWVRTALRLFRGGARVEENGIARIKGTGRPEGVITAPIGSRYTDTAATNGAVEWIKRTGSGTTGWRVLWGDTGWRNVTADLLNGWTATSLKLRRVNDVVHVRAEGLVSNAATAITALSLTAGFQADDGVHRHIVNTAPGNGALPVMRRTDYTNTAYNIYGFGEALTMYGSFSVATSVAWPTTLPGV